MAEDGRWAALGIICAGVILSMSPWFSATAILPELMTHWSVSDAMGAWLTNGVQLGFVIGALLASITGIFDIVRPHRLIAISALLAALLNLALLIAPSGEIAVALRVLTGVVLAGVYPPAMKLITTWFVQGRGLALGLVIGALTVGSAFPHLIRALTPGVNWQIVVFGTTAMSFMAAYLFHAFGREGPFSYPRAPFHFAQIGKILKDRGVMLANVGYFGHMWELYAMWGWFLAFSGAVLAANGIETESGASLITFGVIACGVVGCVAGGWLADRIGRTGTTALMMGVSGTCALLIGLTFNGPLWLFVLIAVIWGISVIGDSAQFSAVVTEVGDRSLVGTALAFQMGVGFALTVVAIQLTPLFAEWVGGWQWAFLLLVPGPLIGTVAMLILRRLPEAERIAQGRG
ncbi:MFS transporter [Methylonatrum kenyense]|uniref:MFS transporter n=1 Tax=Methylonatrum kenyense TaxID=455253 RepID=UPI0020C0D4CC|nr:MFS transporter [Methylonatrum kenyense]